MTTRKQQAQEMRRRIQTTALDMFNAQGFENVSMESIAQSVGCSVGNLYHYFKSKDELALQVTSRVDEAYAVLEAEYLADQRRTAEEKLLDFVGRSLQISCEDPALYKAFIHAMKHPQLATLQRSEHRVYFRVLSTLVEMNIRDGFLSPAHSVDEVVEYLVTLHRGTLLEWRIYQEKFDIVRRGRAMAQVLLRGLR